MHGGDDRCSERLEWVQYAKTKQNGEVIPFDLGRSRYGGGEPADYEKDHFPTHVLKHCRALEHFCFDIDFILVKIPLCSAILRGAHMHNKFDWSSCQANNLDVQIQPNFCPFEKL